MSDALTSIGPYAILESVSEGGMSFVYKAVDETQNLTVALKVLKPIASEMIRRHRDAGQTDWEGDIALGFDHPHVIHTYERGQDMGRHYLAMELLDPFTLRYLTFARSPLAKVNRYRLLDEIADALAYVHEQGFIHRDVSPKNVLVGPASSAKIIDFGLTIPIRAASRCKDARSGSVSYMAPEQLDGRELDPRCDIYGLGVTMHEVLTGRLPRRASRHASSGRHRAVKPLSPSRYDPAIPEAVDAVVSRALQEDPNDRFASMGELRDAFRQAAPADPPGKAARVREGRRFLRVELNCFVTFVAMDRWGMGRQFRTLTKDLSLDGACCIRLAQPLPTGARLDLNLWLRGHPRPLSISVEVMWCRPADADNGGHEIGLGFVGIAPDDRERLRLYLIAHGGRATADR